MTVHVVEVMVEAVGRQGGAFLDRISKGSGRYDQEEGE